LDFRFTLSQKSLSLWERARVREIHDETKHTSHSRSSAPTAPLPADAEAKLWARLRSRQLCGFKFRRQYPIGGFITDFCCFEQRLVVELDGGQHAERTQADQSRSDVLTRHGYRVLRFWDNEVMKNIDEVLQRIVEALSNPNINLKPSPVPSPIGRGSKGK
jgi:very-short-patch-repair endonuclease